MPYCTTCGSEVIEEMLFCHQCGRKLRIPQGGLKVNNIHDPTAQVEAPANISSPRIRRDKLYKQWIAHADLPADEPRDPVDDPDDAAAQAHAETAPGPGRSVEPIWPIESSPTEKSKRMRAPVVA